MADVFLAIGHPQVHEIIKGFDNVSICGEVFSRMELFKTLGKTRPNILIVSEFLKEANELDLVSFLLQVRAKMPQTRIIYIAGNMEVSNPAHRQRIQSLVKAGVYDICTMSRISPRLLEMHINSPASIDSLSEWLDQPSQVAKVEPPVVKKDSHRPISATTPKAPMSEPSIGAFIDEEGAKILSDQVMQVVQGQNEDDYMIKNVFIVSSIKPGSGKSFLSTNIATAIAKYGAVGPHGRPPTVALIEGDLQNLSIGTLLSFQEDKHNLKTAIEKIDSILDKKKTGMKAGVTQQQIEEVDKFIKGCLKPYSKVKNLYALVGSQFQPDELRFVTKHHYIYLIETIAELVDVVIVDTNSALNHVTTYPLLQLANQCFYVLNLDYNNIHNNHRYRQKLSNMGIGGKLRYILNEDITQNRDNKEKLIFGVEELIESGYDLVGRIPAIDKSVFLNRLHEGTPIILDDSNLTLKARWEIAKIANQIWPMTNLVDLEHAYNRYEAKTLREESTSGGLFGLFRK